MAEWESSYSGRFLDNARILTNEEIEKRYPLGTNSSIARSTRECVKRGYNILYGENPNLMFYNFLDYDWRDDVIVTAAYLYNTTPDKIILRCYTDMSEPKAIYAAVKLRNYPDIPII